MIWPQKHEIHFFTKVRSQRAHFFYISPPPGHLFGPYFKVTARTNNRNPAVLFSQRYKPHLANWQKLRLNSTILRFFVIARDRRIAPASQAGVGFGLWSGSPVWFCWSLGRHEIKFYGERKGLLATGGGVFPGRCLVWRASAGAAARPLVQPKLINLGTQLEMRLEM